MFSKWHFLLIINNRYVYVKFGTRPTLRVVVTRASLYYTELCIIDILFNVYITIFKPLQF
jgi:hypothetical protein